LDTSLVWTPLCLFTARTFPSFFAMGWYELQTLAYGEDVSA
jgi:hypothetical protein